MRVEEPRQVIMLGGPQPVIGRSVEVKVLIRGRATVLGTHTYSCSNPRATTRKTAPAPYRNDHPRVTTRGPG
jgi:hypothetical protein